VDAAQRLIAESGPFRQSDPKGGCRPVRRLRRAEENLMATIRLKRAYEEPAESDGLRILVERLWPRGLSKERAAVDLWVKEVAPSPELRKWYGHDPAKWDEFQRRYWAELEANEDAVAELRRRVCEEPVTFVYAARDEQRNSATILKEYLRRHRS
jgi:uncharacterized protein YeaO (DUF488 family)